MDDDNKIIFRAILEILGKPADHVETTIQSLLRQIKAMKEFKVKESFVSDAKEQEHLYSIFAEIELETASISNLIGFCFDFMPSSIEILAPEKVALSASDMSDFLTDLQAKLHQGDMVTKKLNSVNIFLRRNMHSLIKNYVLLILKGERKDLPTMAKLTGIGESDLKQFLDVLVKDGIIVITDSGYQLK